MKKILIVSDYFYPHWTGIVKGVFNMTQVLKNDFNFTVLTIKHDKNLMAQENVSGVKIIRENYLFSFSRAKFSLTLLIKFILIARKYDVILINSPFSLILPVSLLTKIFNKKLLIFHQGDLILPKGLFNKFLEKIFDLSTIISFTFAHKVSSYTLDYAKHSRVLKKHLKKFTPLIMPLIFQVNQTKNETIEALKRNGKIIIGFGGRFVEEKGFDILFRALPKILEKIPNAHFVFAGELRVSYENFFEKTKKLYDNVKNNVTILGLLNDFDLYSFYKSIDVVVIPSRSDCFPIFQAEAMFLGAPSVVSDIPGAREIVKLSGYGAIFQKENPDDLALKMCLVIKQLGELSPKHDKVIDILNTNKNAQAIRKFIEE